MADAFESLLSCVKKQKEAAFTQPDRSRWSWYKYIFFIAEKKGFYSSRFGLFSPANQSILLFAQNLFCRWEELQTPQRINLFYITLFLN